MDWIIDNWYVCLGFLALGILIGDAIVCFFKMPSSKQIENIKEWLKYAVTIAEKEFAGGTGQLKLRFVYNLFVEKFGWVARLITFEQFSLYVDEALEWLKTQLESNKAIKEIVEK